MASSPVKFLFAFLVVCVVGWILFTFAARLLAWFLSRILGASVVFKVAGCNCLRDIHVKFNKGSIHALSIGEIKLSLRKSLVKLGFSFISRDPKLQLLICDMEVVLRSSVSSTKRSKSRGSRATGRGKWMVITNVARMLSISVTELVIKVPSAAFEVKDIRVEMSKSGGPSPVLNIKLYLIPLLVQIGDSQPNLDQFCFDQWEMATAAEKYCAPFICEDMSVVSEVSHDKEQGLRIKSFDMTCGDITVKLSESLFAKRKLKSEVFADSVSSGVAGYDPPASIISESSKLSSTLKKQIIFFPDKVNFRLPKFNLKFWHRGYELLAESNVMGIHLRSNKTQVFEDSGDATAHFDIQTDMTEIHVLKEVDTSILEILKVVLTASVDIPMQVISSPAQLIRSEIDVKLGGTQCNLLVNRLKPWLSPELSQKKQKTIRADVEKSQKNNIVSVMWTFTVSAPEMTVALYSPSNLPLYYGCSQSSHLFANNIASQGIQVHAELGEVHFYLEEEYQKCVKQDLFDMEANSGSLLHMARVSVDWGVREFGTNEEQDSNRLKLVFAVDVTGMGLYFGFRHFESLMTTMNSFKSFLKSLPISGGRDIHDKSGNVNKATAKGARIIKLNIEKSNIKYLGDVNLEDMVIADPKRVNFGSHGGVVLINASADGTPRRANIMANTSIGLKKLQFSTSLSISRVGVCLNKEKLSLQIDIEKARSIYQEYSQEHVSCSKVTLFEVQHAKFLRRSGILSEIAVCSLINVTDMSIRWEPDVHLAFFELMVLVRCFLHNMKNHSLGKEVLGEDDNLGKTDIEYCSQQEKSYRNYKRESVFAIDVEKLKLTAELADGVEAVVHVQSVFTENARIGLLLEELVLSFNNARVFKSSRVQISRIPVSTISNSSDAKVQHASIWDASTWDWVIQGPDLHICMPHRLQLRAIEDAVEDMWRGLKLITNAKASNMLHMKKNNSRKPKRKHEKFGTIRVIIRKLTADIEEEPIQGWLDEHYQLMKTEICEASTRAKFLDEFLEFETNSKVSELKELCSDRKVHLDGVQIKASNKLAIKDLHEVIQKQAFRSYHRACKKLVPSEGSGAYVKDFQSGFKPSKNRAWLLSLCATDFDVTLTKVVGGDDAMLEFIKKIDPISLEKDIAFSRTYGREIDLTTGSLVFQLRDYTFPLFSATAGKCKGRIVLAQQATCFQPQTQQDVYIGKWWKVRMLRSASGTTPPMKLYSELPIYFDKAEISFGVGYEPAFADISYAFTVALRRANLGRRNWTSSIRDQNGFATVSGNNPPKKERSLPWWDDMRYYIHGRICLFFMESRWILLATTNPYEKLDELQIVSGYMEIQQTDGRVFVLAKDFRIYLSSLESLLKNCSLKLPNVSVPFIQSPAFSLDVTMDWDCESGCPLNHYLHALPKEGEPRKKVFDPFRSTSLSLRWNFSLRPSLQLDDECASFAGAFKNVFLDGSIPDCVFNMKNPLASPTMNLGAHDLAWLFKWWGLNYSPPHKIRSFSRWPRFGIPRATRSGNLSLDKVMTEFCLRLDATPACIRYTPLSEDDPANGLTFKMTRLKYELCYSRGRQLYTFQCKREPLDLVYQGLDLHLLNAFLCKNNNTHDVQTAKGASLSLSTDNCGSEFTNTSGFSEKNGDHGFLLYSDYFTIRRQAPKADPARLLAWQEAGRRNVEMTYVRSEFENGSESDHTRSDPSDDDGFNVVIADNCRRVFVYGLKLLWTIENRDAVWSWVGGISKAFEPQKPSPSRQYAQRKLLEEQQRNEGHGIPRDDNLRSSAPHDSHSPPSQHIEVLGSASSVSPSSKMEHSTSSVLVNHGYMGDSEEEGIRHFMVNVIQPQFNLHSEEANGRFLLAAASGRILARSFHSVLHVGYDMIEQALGTSSAFFPDTEPEMTWKRAELSVMLEHVQAHVAPTDVDPGAGLQWLPKILRSSPKVKRTGALLERVFMPCQMYFRYTRHKGGTTELKVKPLKELIFNSPNITATMTSRQFQVMLDVLSNLLFARLPKPRKSSLSYPTDDDDDVEEEADEVVPDGVEEVELARIELEQKERERKLHIDDIRTLSSSSDIASNLSSCPDSENDLWMLSCGKLRLVRGLRKELVNAQKCRKEASSALRMALQKAAQMRLMEKEKNKSPSYAMRISMRINKVVWSMLADGKSFAEAEINDMIYDFDRDYKDIGVSQFTTKSFVVRNCLLNAKSDMLLSAWNAPPEWGRNVMLRVNAKQGAPKDGNSQLELFQVEIYPLKIHLTETMYRMMWGYFFPEEDQDSQRRQEVWKVSTSAGSRRLRKNVSGHEVNSSSSQSIRESESTGRHLPAGSNVNAIGSVHGDSSQTSVLQNLKANMVCGSNPEIRRTSSYERVDDNLLCESTSSEPIASVQASFLSSKSGPLHPVLESQQAVAEETSRSRSKESKSVKCGRLSHEEKKIGKPHDEKRARSRKLMEFHNIKISQVELLVTYEGSRFAVNDLRLLMDTFHRDEFIGTWRRLFSRVKKHIIWGVLKSVTGMQGKKFKDKAQGQREGHVGVVPEGDLNFSDSDGGQPGKLDQFPVSWLRRPSDGAGDGFVTSIRGLFNSQRRKAKAFVLRTMRGEAESEFHGDWSESDTEYPFARQLTITKAKKLIRRHTRKFRSRAQKNSGAALQIRESNPSTPRETTPFQSDSSGGSSYEDFKE